MTEIERTFQFLHEETARFLRKAQEGVGIAGSEEALWRWPREGGRRFGEEGLRFVRAETERFRRSQRPPLAETLQALQGAGEGSLSPQALGRIRSLYPELFPFQNPPLLETLAPNPRAQRVEGKLEATFPLPIPSRSKGVMSQASWPIPRERTRVQ